MHEARVKSGERAGRAGPQEASRGRDGLGKPEESVGRGVGRPASQPRLYLRDHRSRGTRRWHASIIILCSKSSDVASSGFILRRISI